jgi:glycosyltransferase involved in cell wall biosynthesis
MAFPRIAFITGTLGFGGIETNLGYVTEALLAAGARFQILSMTRGEYWEYRFREKGIPCNWVGNSSLVAPQLMRMLRQLRREPVDIVQAQNFWVNPYALATARILGIREIGTMRSQLAADLRNLPHWAGRYTLKRLRLLSVNSQAGIRDATNYGVAPAHLTYFPNAVDTRRFVPPRERSSDPVTLLTVGRLVASKRYDRFLRMLARVAKRTRKSFRALIVGSGPQRAELVDLAKRLGLYPGTVDFVPATAEVLSFYQRAHIFVLTSDFEGTPNAMLEAMACGLPVVATRVGDVSECIRQGEEGYVLETSEEEMSAERLHELVEKPELRQSMGNRARQRVEHQFGLSRLPALLEELYRKRLEM